MNVQSIVYVGLFFLDLVAKESGSSSALAVGWVRPIPIMSLFNLIF